MIWFFQRGGQVVQVETRVDAGTQDYELVIRWPDRPAETERFQTLEAFDTRIKELDQRLMTENYAQAGGPTLLAEGWRGPFPAGGSQGRSTVWKFVGWEDAVQIRVRHASHPPIVAAC